MNRKDVGAKASDGIRAMFPIRGRYRIDDGADFGTETARYKARMRYGMGGSRARPFPFMVIGLGLSVLAVAWWARR